jgi:hypothetical protein
VNACDPLVGALGAGCRRFKSGRPDKVSYRRRLAFSDRAGSAEQRGVGDGSSGEVIPEKSPPETVPFATSELNLARATRTRGEASGTRDRPHALPTPRDSPSPSPPSSRDPPPALPAPRAFGPRPRRRGPSRRGRAKRAGGTERNTWLWPSPLELDRHAGSRLRFPQFVEQTRELEVRHELHLDVTEGTLVLVGVP